MKKYVLADGITAATVTLGPLIMSDNGGIYVQMSGTVAQAGILTIQTSADGVHWINDDNTIVLTVDIAVAARQYSPFCQYVRFSYANTGTGTISLVVNVMG